MAKCNGKQKGGIDYVVYIDKRDCDKIKAGIITEWPKSSIFHSYSVGKNGKVKKIKINGSTKRK